jgi:hypothetical protein
MRTSILMFAFLLSGAVAFAQGPIPRSGQVEAGKAEREFEKTVPPPIRLARLNELQAGQSLGEEWGARSGFAPV